ncbi:MAG TPA: amidohydrolase family protein [Candidatus Limnocylindrales bacterium]|nr:amidohydrolase family protein [Candidatus Limnocylindrales bacterium]
MPEPEPTLPETIDVHAHLVDAASADAMHELLPEHVATFRRLDDGTWRCTFPSGKQRPVPSGLVDPEVRLADMDAQGIGLQAVSCSTWLYLYAAPAERAAAALRLQNDAFCALARDHPGRFAALACLPLQDPVRAVAEIARLAERPEVAGVGIATNVAGTDLDAPGFAPVWGALQEADLPVLVHPYPESIAGRERLGDYHLANLIGNPLETTIAVARLACSGILDRFPRLRFGFVHGGGFVPYQLGRWDHGWEVRPETRQAISSPPSEHIGRFTFDALTHDPRSTAFLRTRLGLDRMVVGTDYPWDMSVGQPLEALAAAGLSPAEVARIAGPNARAFLRLPAA